MNDRLGSHAEAALAQRQGPLLARPLPYPACAFSKKSVFNNKTAGERGRAVAGSVDPAVGRDPSGQLSRPDGFVLASLADGDDDPAPHGGAVVILRGEQLIRRARRFPQCFLSVALEHQGRGSPDVDFGYHSPRLSLIGERTQDLRTAAAADSFLQNISRSNDT
jgi:hypothetical protein